MITDFQSGVQCQGFFRSCSARLIRQVSIFCLFTVLLSAGCVSKEQFESEKVRGLNFQRLLAQEEKRADTLDAKLAQKDKEIVTLNAQLQEMKDKVASLESQNRDLTIELDALKEQSRHQAEQESVPDSTTLSKDSGLSKEKALSDPFLSEEELLKILGRNRSELDGIQPH